ncbi:MAG: hypothetical protein U0931_11975 [Vulcanimicrobiota bacterium]
MTSLSRLSPLRQTPAVRPQPPAAGVETPSHSGREPRVAGGAALLLGLGAAGGALAAPTAQVQLSRADSVKALRQLNYLEQVAQEHGGSLRSQATNPLGQLVNYQPEVEPVEALDHLSQGYTLYYYAGPQAAPVAIHSAQELKSFTGQVREQQLDEKLDRGDFQGAARTLGDQLGDLFP